MGLSGASRRASQDFKGDIWGWAALRASQPQVSKVGVLPVGTKFQRRNLVSLFAQRAQSDCCLGKLGRTCLLTHFYTKGPDLASGQCEGHGHRHSHKHEPWAKGQRANSLFEQVVAEARVGSSNAGLSTRGPRKGKYPSPRVMMSDTYSPRNRKKIGDTAQIRKT